MAVDYVCGTHIDENKVDFRVIHKDKTYYFCSDECKTAFEKGPEKIIKERQDPWNSVGKSRCC